MENADKNVKQKVKNHINLVLPYFVEKGLTTMGMRSLDQKIIKK
jgi:hypothetical protein